MSPKQARSRQWPAGDWRPHGRLPRKMSKQKPPESSTSKWPVGFRFLVLATMLVAVPVLVRAEATLEEVASFPNQQVTGVTVSPQGRVFVNFPFWSDDHTTSVAEIIDGEPKPYPDAKWNAKDGSPQARWICVQSVVVDDRGALWVLDPASPKTEGVVKGGAKLVKIDLGTNKIVQMISFDETTAPPKSYLNDVRVDTKTDHAYITESGTGALIVVDLNTGTARRLLADHPSTKAEPDAEIIVDEMKIIEPKTGKAPAIHADGIAFDKEGDWLYYHPLSGKSMYRIKTEHLRDVSLSDTQLAAKVEKLAETPKPDGMLEGRDGMIYLAAFEQNAVMRFDPGTKKTTTAIADERLQWPDTLAWGPDGKLYVTTSQIHRMPKYHRGENKQKGPFMVYRITMH